MAPPKAGRRGDLAPRASLALDRDLRYRGEHEQSLQRPAAPQTWEACVAWFRDAWEASLPRRMHTAGVEDESALGSPRMAGAMHRRIDQGNRSWRDKRTGQLHVSHDGWGLTGWDKDGKPYGVNADGLSIDPFLYYLERMLRGKNDHERMGALALQRWAYLGWDTDEAANHTFVAQRADPETWDLYRAGYKALLRMTIATLWVRCQREPERWPICKGCRQRECVCGQRSEAQVNAEEAEG